MIILSPIGGLANRMRVLNAGIGLTLATKKRLIVLWRSNHALNCKFNDIFEFTGETYPVFQYSFGSRLNHILESGFALRCKILHQADMLELLDQTEKIQELAEKNHLFIETYSDFYPNPLPYKQFQPSESIRRIVETFSRQFGESTIGVHIRRGDNQKSIENSTIEKFVNHMKMFAEKDSETRFFVATDSPKEEYEMSKIFPGRILTYPKRSLDRNVPVAIQDALVDLYCLSKCRKLIGSYWSSFTDVAAAINNIEVLIAR
jgi:hypothetical protein